MEKAEKNRLLAGLPSVDEVLKYPDAQRWNSEFQRRVVLQAIREVIAAKRSEMLAGKISDLSPEILSTEIRNKMVGLSSFSLQHIINATGVVIHTNLGRAPLSEKILNNVGAVSSGYSNLEYDLANGKRGRRHDHTKRLLVDVTGAEDAIIVNNNAAAVLLCLNTIARGKEVIVSRSELVEIGGSFRVPDVMAASGAILREVGTTNKTHLYDYENAVNEDTALILKVHQSNYKIIGFTDAVAIEDLVSLGRRHGLPVMYDLGSGCLIDLKPYGIYDEPSVSDIVRADVDIVSFSGDKLLGGPQGGVIAGKKGYVERIQKNPLARAVRIDKFAIAAFEATLMAYLDPEKAKTEIPVLDMLLQPPAVIQARAKTIASRLGKTIRDASIAVVRDTSMAGGGSLPEVVFPTYAVSIKPVVVSVNELESRLRRSSPPVVARIKEDSIILDARTIRKGDIDDLVRVVASSLQSC